MCLNFIMWLCLGNELMCLLDSPPSSSDDEMEVQLKDSSDTIEELQGQNRKNFIQQDPLHVHYLEAKIWSFPYLLKHSE